MALATGNACVQERRLGQVMLMVQHLGVLDNVVKLATGLFDL